MSSGKPAAEVAPPAPVQRDAVIETRDLTKHFTVRKGLAGVLGGGRMILHAVDDVTFWIPKGEIFGLAGESGCGKTTLGRLLVRLVEPTRGRIFLDHTDITQVEKEGLRRVRERVQMIFQDPYESLNPRMTVYDTLAEPLRVHGLVESREQELDRVLHVMEDVELTPVEDFVTRFPHQLSGGQRQRVAVARALVLKPTFLVADEPVSMLDVSIRAEILNLLLDMRDKLQLSMLFITHDLSIARHMCDRLAIMYLGKIVEVAPVDEIVNDPLHPYTVALLQAVPDPDPDAARSKVVVKGEVPSAIWPPVACRFHTRCPIAIEKCRTVEPLLIEVKKDHFAACHRAGEYQP